MIKKRKKIITMLIIFMFIILLIILLIILSSKDNKNSKSKQEKTPLEWNVPEGTGALINFYFVKESGLMIALKDEEDIYKNSKNYTYFNSYKCDLKDCKSYGFNKENNYVIIKDNGYLIYDYKKNLAKKVNLPSDSYNSIEFLTHNKKDYGLSVSNSSGKYAFYDLKNERFTTEFKYSEILPNETACLLKDNFIALDNSIYYVVNYKNKEVIQTSDTYIGSIGNENVVYYYKRYDKENNSKLVFYNDKFDPLFDGDFYSSYGLSNAGNIAVTSDLASFIIFNRNGFLVKESKPYKHVFLILDNYIVVKDNDDYLKIVDYDGNIISKVVRFEDNKTLDLDLSGLKEINDKKTIFLVTLDADGKRKVYYYTLDEKKITGLEIEN